MRRLLGFAFLGSGLAFAGLAYAPSSEDREQRLAEMTRILTAPTEPTTRVAPPQPMTTPVETGAIDVAAVPAPSAPRLALAPAMPVAPSEQAAATSAPANPQPAAAPPPDRATLVRHIQSELKRTGCYRGDVHGWWNKSTQRAMKAFVDEVNAHLPIENPDQILLTLLKGHDGGICGGRTCPSGQHMTNGRCAPAPVIARAPEPAETKLVRQDVAAVPAPTARPARTPSSASTPQWTTETRVAVAAPPAPVAVAPAAPLPGRMSIGAAKDADAAITSPPAARGWDTEIVTPVGRTPEATAPRPQRTAALVETEPAPRRPVAATPSLRRPVVKAPRPTARPSAAKAPSRARRISSRHGYTARSVQQLFTHPLGRM